MAWWTKWLACVAGVWRGGRERGELNFPYPRPFVPLQRRIKLVSMTVWLIELMLHWLTDWISEDWLIDWLIRTKPGTWMGKMDSKQTRRSRGIRSQMVQWKELLHVRKVRLSNAFKHVSQRTVWTLHSGQWKFPPTQLVEHCTTERWWYAMSVSAQLRSHPSPNPTSYSKITG